MGTNGQGDVHMYKCDGYSDQKLVYCEDKTIRNEAMNTCLKSDNGNIVADSCYTGKHPDWTLIPAGTKTIGGIDQDLYKL